MLTGPRSLRTVGKPSVLFSQNQGIILKNKIPLAILLAGAQAGWAQRAITGPRTPPTKTLGDGTNGTTLPPSGWVFHATYGVTTTNAALADFNGYDTNGIPIVIQHAGAHVYDNIVTKNSSYSAVGAGIVIGTGTTFNNTVIEYNNVNGKGDTTTAVPTMNNGGIIEHASSFHGGLIVRGNWVHGTGSDTLEFNSSGALIELNRLGVGGWNSPAAHADIIQIQNVLGTDGPIIVRRNFCDITRAGAPGTAYGLTSSITMSGAPQGILIYENVLHYDASGTGGATPIYNATGGVDNIQIYNNAMDWTLAPVFPTTVLPYTTWSNNFRLSNSAIAPAPTVTTTEWQREDGNFWTREDTFFWQREGL